MIIFYSRLTFRAKLSIAAAFCTLSRLEMFRFGHAKDIEVHRKMCMGVLISRLFFKST